MLNSPHSPFPATALPSPSSRSAASPAAAWYCLLLFLQCRTGRVNHRHPLKQEQCTRPTSRNQMGPLCWSHLIPGGSKLQNSSKVQVVHLLSHPEPKKTGLSRDRGINGPCGQKPVRLCRESPLLP